MKVITLKQPWATLVAEGYKEYEFRTWKTSYRGEIYIHAGKGIDKVAMKRVAHLNLDYPSGCILAKGNLIDCLPVNQTFREKLKELDTSIYHNIVNNMSWKGYAFQLKNIKKVKPITCKGKLSIWEYKEKSL